MDGRTTSRFSRRLSERSRPSSTDFIDGLLVANPEFRASDSVTVAYSSLSGTRYWIEGTDERIS